MGWTDFLIDMFFSHIHLILSNSRGEDRSPKQRLQLEIKWRISMHLPKRIGHNPSISSAL